MTVSRSTDADSAVRRDIARPRSAVLGMTASRGDGAGVAGPICAFLALAGNRDVAFEDEKPRVELVGMLGVYRVRLHAAIDDFAVSLRAYLGLEFRPVHRLSPQCVGASYAITDYSTMGR